MVTYLSLTVYFLLVLQVVVECTKMTAVKAQTYVVTVEHNHKAIELLDLI